MQEGLHPDKDDNDAIPKFQEVGRRIAPTVRAFLNSSYFSISKMSYIILKRLLLISVGTHIQASCTLGTATVTDNCNSNRKTTCRYKRSNK